jgi:undecaprenyl-diphosphatase
MRTFLHTFDHQVTSAIQHWPSWLQPVFLAVTTMGHPAVTVSIAALAVGGGWIMTNARLALAGVIVWVGMAIGTTTKLLLQRERPITDYVMNMRVETFSFPSGHTLGSTLAYGLLAYLAWHYLSAPWNYIATAILVALIIMVGISRIYLGAHYPSDVAAGWLLGGIGLLIIIFFIQPKL